MTDQSVSDDLDADPWCCNGNAEDCVLCTDPNPPYPFLCPGHPLSASNQRLVGEAVQAAEADVCRPVEVDGETVRVRGSGELTEEGREALAALVRAAKDKFIAEAPAKVGELQNRLRLAHKARRAKEHQLDGVRRALCDAGFMEDDDPYSHADLADVIRQAAPRDGEANAIATEIHRRMVRLKELQADPEARQSVVENVRGEVLGLQSALGIVLGGTVPGSSADSLAKAYYTEWLGQKAEGGL